MGKERPWESKWVRGEFLGAGGQGHTFLLRRCEEESFDYVLKTLKYSKDEKRRRRMYREVANLKSLSHSGVARHVDDNTELFEQPDVELFLVMGRIEGAHPKGPVDLDSAIATTVALLKILEYCHGEDVGHRDIKPENVILRKNQADDPVLLDFGLSFNASDDSSATSLAEAVGPRGFLHLPEHSGGSADKRSHVSDVTLCVGLLFYLLTGHFPRDLRDHSDQPPHRRAVADVLRGLPQPVQTELDRVFDVGFESDIRLRWPSAKAAREALERVTKPNEPEDFEQGLGDFARRYTALPVHKVRDRQEELKRMPAAIVNAVITKVGLAVGEHLQLQLEHSELSSGLQSYLSCKIQDVRTPSRLVRIELLAQIQSQEYVLYGIRHSSPYDGKHRVKVDPSLECARLPIFDPTAERTIKLAIQRLFTGALGLLLKESEDDENQT